MGSEGAAAIPGAAVSASVRTLTTGLLGVSLTKALAPTGMPVPIEILSIRSRRAARLREGVAHLIGHHACHGPGGAPHSRGMPVSWANALVNPKSSA